MALFSINQAHDRFKILYDKVDSFNSPEFTPEEIDEFLNIGQEELIRIVTLNGIEKSQEVADYLKNITKTTIVNTFTANVDRGSPIINSFKVTLPSDYYTALLEEASVSLPECGVTVTKRLPVIPITRDRYNRIIKDPFNNPSTDTVIRLVSSEVTGADTFELIVGAGYSLNEYYLDYIRRPLRIRYGTQYVTAPFVDQNCELVDKAYYRVIDIAVDKALEAMRLKQIQPQKQQ